MLQKFGVVLYEKFNVAMIKKLRVEIPYVQAEYDEKQCNKSYNPFTPHKKIDSCNLVISLFTLLKICSIIIRQF